MLKTTKNAPIKPNLIGRILNNVVTGDIVPEVKFHPTRRWRFDFAHIQTKTAIEIEGGAFTNGRHTRGVGYIGDMEKYNAAVELGWVVLRYTPQSIKKSVNLQQIRTVIKNRLTINA